MIEEKTIPLNELNYYYSERQGFVFTAGIPSSSDAIERLCIMLVDKKVAEKMPEFFTRPNSNTFVVVFPEGASFQSPGFYQIGKQCEMMGICKVDILGAWLKIVHKN
jgi:hypothetical protein